MTTFYLASTNPIKEQEYAALLAMWGITLRLFTPAEHLAVPETGHTYLENATLKAQCYSAAFPQRLILADDSGLTLAACPDQLGVHTARSLAPYATASAKNQVILRQIEHRQRSFTMTSALVLMLNGTMLTQGVGTLTGVIAPAERGDYSGGLDRILIPDQTSLTLAERPFVVRRPYLHRYRALIASDFLLCDSSHVGDR